MKCILCFFSGLLLTLSHASYAQPSFSGKNVADHLLIKVMDKSLYDAPEVPVVGTPYLNESFVPGIVYSNKASFKEIPMRYNIHMDHIEFKENDITYILDPEPRVKKISINEHVFVVAKMDVIGKMKDGFFLLLDSGKVQLLARKVVSFKEAQAPKALESSATPAKYVTLPDRFFYRFGNGELVKINSVKKMIAAFPDRQEELSQFAKKEKISAGKQAELVRLIQYYNSL